MSDEELEAKIRAWHEWLDRKFDEYRIAGIDAPNLDALWEAAHELSLGDPDPPEEWIRIPRWVFRGLVYSLSLLKSEAPKTRTKRKGRPPKDRTMSPREAAREYALHFPRWIAVRHELKRQRKLKLPGNIDAAFASVAGDDEGAPKDFGKIRDSYYQIEQLRKRLHNR